MNLTLTEEQRLIQTSAMDWLAANYDFRRREDGVHRAGGSPAAWRAFAEMGWLALPLPEAAGGLGGGPLEVGLLMQALGRHLVVEPVHGSVLQAARLLALNGTAAQQAAWLPGAVSGAHRLALVHGEPGERLPWARRRTSARRVGQQWSLEGRKRMAIGAPGAARWLVSASEVNGPDRVFLVDPAAPGVTSSMVLLADGGCAADVEFTDVLLTDADLLPAAPPVGLSPLHAVLAESLLASCWEATGAMQSALEQTVAYTAQRRQFGQPLAAFQVVQHRLAEMTVQCIEAQAVCELAAMRMARDPSNAVEEATVAKSKVARAARFVAQEAVQLHGAMGVCEELPVAATFRKLQAFAAQGGDAASHSLHYGRSLLAAKRFDRSRTLTPDGADPSMLPAPEQPA